MRNHAGLILFLVVLVAMFVIAKVWGVFAVLLSIPLFVVGLTLVLYPFIKR